MEELRTNFYNFYVMCEENGIEDIEYIIKEFCNRFSTCIEEYMYMYEILADGFGLL